MWRFLSVTIVSSDALQEKQFAFEADAWQRLISSLLPARQHHQGDDPLLTVLKYIRSGMAGEHTKIPLRTRYKNRKAPSKPLNYIHVILMLMRLMSVNHEYNG